MELDDVDRGILYLLREERSVERAELGLDVVNSKFIESTRVQPFDRFGRSVVEGDDE